MFSPRLLAALAVLACAAALPATDKPAPRPVTTITDDELDDTPWFSMPMLSSLFGPLWRLLPSFGDIGPRITADADKFQVVVNVQDYKKEDLKVKVKGDFIFVQGSHEAKHDDRDVFASQFFHTYTLPANCSGGDVTAQLTSDGYLVVSTPLNGGAKEGGDRDVPIVETGAPYKEETTTAKVDTTRPISTSAVSDDDRKEPTTPPTRDETTDSDNNIHGNEIL